MKKTVPSNTFGCIAKPAKQPPPVMYHPELDKPIYGTKGGILTKNKPK